MYKLSNKEEGRRGCHSQYHLGKKCILKSTYIQVWFKLYYMMLKCFQLIIITIVNLFLHFKIDY